MSALSIKRGASLTLGIVVSRSDGTPYDLAGVTINAELRDAADNLVASLPVSTPGGGQCNIHVADTSAWPVGTLRGDFRLTTGAAVLFSETFTLTVERPVTRTAAPVRHFNTPFLPIAPDGLTEGAVWLNGGVPSIVWSGDPPTDPPTRWSLVDLLTTPDGLRPGDWWNNGGVPAVMLAPPLVVGNLPIAPDGLSPGDIWINNGELAVA